MKSHLIMSSFFPVSSNTSLLCTMKVNVLVAQLCLFVIYTIYLYLKWQPESHFQFCSYLAPWPWAMHLRSLGLSFLLGKMRTIWWWQNFPNLFLPQNYMIQLCCSLGSLVTHSELECYNIWQPSLGFTTFLYNHHCTPRGDHSQNIK